MKEWFEKSFGEDYMLVYRHRDDEQAKREVHAMVEWLNIKPAEHLHVLDIGCGTGRHSITLRELGFQVTGLDLSDVLLEEAKKYDIEQKIQWIQGDMRKMPFPNDSFAITLNLFTSFGYFQELEQNESVIANIARVLAPNGQFIIDFFNPIYIKDNFIPYNKRIDEESHCIIEEFRTIRDKIIEKKIVITSSSSKIRTYKEQVTLLPLMWFQQCFDKHGFKLEQLYGHYDGRSYAEHSPRMIMVGTKIR